MALAHSTLPGTVNIGNPHEMPVREIAEQIREITRPSSTGPPPSTTHDDAARTSACPPQPLAVLAEVAE